MLAQQRPGQHQGKDGDQVQEHAGLRYRDARYTPGVKPVGAQRDAGPQIQHDQRRQQRQFGRQLHVRQQHQAAEPQGAHAALHQGQGAGRIAARQPLGDQHVARGADQCHDQQQVAEHGVWRISTGLAGQRQPGDAGNRHAAAQGQRTGDVLGEEDAGTDSHKDRQHGSQYAGLAGRGTQQGFGFEQEIQTGLAQCHEYQPAPVSALAVDAAPG